MDLHDILTRYDETLAEWRRRLAQFSDQTFNAAPAGEWTAARIFDHIAAVQAKCIANSEACARGEGERKLLAIGPAIFSMMGSFPPIRIRVKKIPPGLENIYQPRAVTREEAARTLDAMQKEMHRAAKTLPAGSRSRVKHWAGGWFNAEQWFHSAEMHLRHHLRQLDRLEKPRG